MNGPRVYLWPHAPAASLPPKVEKRRASVESITREWGLFPG